MKKDAFLQLPKDEKILNKVTIIPLGRTKEAFNFQPFIESYKHVVTPKISKESFGLFSVSTFYRNGITDNEFQVTIVLPAGSAADAKTNYDEVQRFKKFVTPSIRRLQKQTGLVTMSINPLMKKRTGYITAVDESVELDAGFAAGYPKVIKLSFTFSVDELYEATRNRTGGTRNRAAKSDKKPKKKTSKTIAARAAEKKAAKAVGLPSTENELLSSFGINLKPEE
tara:strand:+ start:21014 stop:21688 length:675 start_codon:yes stop_codon:yes gene_type:complete